MASQVWEEGDWTCNACSNLNFASRQVCNRCQGPKPPPAELGAREGDWMCPACNNHNYSKRMACNKCQGPRPGGGMGAMMGGFGGGKGKFAMPTQMQQMAPMGGAPAPNGNFRQGDWVCTQCSNHNYSSREACNKCQGPKPLGGGGCSGYGGGGCGGCGGYGCGGYGGFGCKGGYGASSSQGFKGAGMGGRFSPYAVPAMTNIGANMRPGDWACPGCSNHNYASRENCNKCQRAKNMPPNFREGDWMCASCSNHNYANKTACNKCKEQKPQA